MSTNDKAGGEVATINAPYGRWEPAPPGEVASIFAKTPCPWWVAGGYAIELAVGRPIREHGDIDVMVLRRDQLHVQRVLDGWEWWAADPPGTLRPWARGEALPVGVHDVWCRPGPAGPWRIQVMLDESDGGDWGVAARRGHLPPDRERRSGRTRRRSPPQS
jgi:hypothetical protein